MNTIQLKTSFIIISLVVLFLCVKCMSPDEKNKTGTLQPFELASVYFEQNSTDGDAEVVFKVKGGDEGITKLLVTAPDDRIVIDFIAPDPTSMGIRQFQLESPEPEDIEAVKQAYPSGIYIFSGIASDGTEFLSEDSLSHILPPPVDIEYPASEAENISVKELEITWTSVNGVKAYLIEIEKEDSNEKIEANLQGSATSFLVPGNFLLPDSEYKIVIGTMSENGNLNFIETAFSTEEK